MASCEIRFPKDFNTLVIFKIKYCLLTVFSFQLQHSIITVTQKQLTSKIRSKIWSSLIFLQFLNFSKCNDIWRMHRYFEFESNQWSKQIIVKLWKTVPLVIFVSIWHFLWFIDGSWFFWCVNIITNIYLQWDSYHIAVSSENDV